MDDTAVSNGENATVLQNLEELPETNPVAIEWAAKAINWVTWYCLKPVEQPQTVLEKFVNMEQCPITANQLLQDLKKFFLADNSLPEVDLLNKTHVLFVFELKMSQSLQDQIKEIGDLRINLYDPKGTIGYFHSNDMDCFSFQPEVIRKDRNMRGREETGLEADQTAKEWVTKAITWISWNFSKQVKNAEAEIEKFVEKERCPIIATILHQLLTNLMKTPGSLPDVDIYDKIHAIFAFEIPINNMIKDEIAQIGEVRSWERFHIVTSFCSTDEKMKTYRDHIVRKERNMIKIGETIDLTDD